MKIGCLLLLCQLVLAAPGYPASNPTAGQKPKVPVSEDSGNIQSLDNILLDGGFGVSDVRLENVVTPPPARFDDARKAAGSTRPSVGGVFPGNPGEMMDLKSGNNYMPDSLARGSGLSGRTRSRRKAGSLKDLRASFNRKSMKAPPSSAKGKGLSAKARGLPAKATAKQRPVLKHTAGKLATKENGKGSRSRSNPPSLKSPPNLKSKRRKRRPRLKDAPIAQPQRQVEETIDLDLILPLGKASSQQIPTTLPSYTPAPASKALQPPFHHQLRSNIKTFQELTEFDILFPSYMKRLPGIHIEPGPYQYASQETLHPERPPIIRFLPLTGCTTLLEVFHEYYIGYDGQEPLDELRQKHMVRFIPENFAEAGFRRAIIKATNALLRAMDSNGEGTGDLEADLGVLDHRIRTRHGMDMVSFGKWCVLRISQAEEARKAEEARQAEE
ncbi:MAG: hypothetical protein SGCHY_000730 [Lobulomycetales sp.]